MCKKILINCYEYPPSIHGGVGTFTRDLAEGLVGKGWEVTVIGIYYDNLLPLEKIIEEQINGVRVIRLPQSKFKLSSINIILDRIRLFFYIRNLHKKEKFDLFESPESTGWFPFGAPVAPLVVRMHGAQIYFDTELKRQGSRLWHLFEKQIIKKAHHLIAVSDYCGRKTLSLIGQKDRAFDVVYNGIDIQRIDEIANNIKSKKMDFRNIVFANSVIKKKGIEELIQAFNGIARDYENTRLIVIGKSLKNTGPNYFDELRKLVDPQYIDRVVFTGWLDNHYQVIRYLAQAEICVYPSHMEGQGIAPVEAMALKKPVIFMAGGPGPEVVAHNKEGLLVDTKSPKEIEKAIRFYLDNKSIAEEHGKAARRKAEERFDKSNWIMQNLKLYQKIIREC